jgi:hypothetical protein
LLSPFDCFGLLSAFLLSLACLNKLLVALRNNAFKLSDLFLASLKLVAQSKLSLLCFCLGDFLPFGPESRFYLGVQFLFSLSGSRSLVSALLLEPLQLTLLFG